jgi:rubredoxin
VESDRPRLGRRECGICWTVYDPAAGDDLAQVPPGTPFEALPEKDEFRRSVEAALGRLPEEQRHVLVLKIWGELTFEEIGEVMEGGTVSEVVLDPETEIGKCVRKALLQETFPEPPVAPFYDLMRLSFK